jgi:hypothetical protein
MGPLHWFTVSNGRTPIDVFLSVESVTSDLKGIVAVTIPARGNFVVYVDATVPRHDQDEELFHELCGHCALAGKRGHFDRYSQAEETAIRKQQRGAWQILRNLGFRWPRRPYGTAALERLGTEGVPDPK